MAIIYSNKITVTVSGVSYTYSLQLSANESSLPSSGGQVTFTANLMNTTLNQPVSGVVVTLTDLTTGQASSQTTDSNGIAVFYVTIPSNTSTTSETYSFQASATV